MARMKSLLLDLFIVMAACHLFCITALYCSACSYLLFPLDAKYCGEQNVFREKGLKSHLTEKCF